MITFRMLPAARMSNTTIGSALSMQSEMAVASMTRSCRSSTCRYEMLWYFVAVLSSIGVAGAGGEDHDPALLEVADGAPADEGLGHRAHLDGGHDAGQDAGLLERVL